MIQLCSKLAFLVVFAGVAGCNTNPEPGQSPSPTETAFSERVANPGQDQPGELHKVAIATARTDWRHRVDVLVREALSEWNVPGAAIAIVENDEIVYESGFGVRKIGEAGAVNEHTQFAIASVTKSFTSIVLAMLVDEEKLRWDDRVATHFPEFKLHDAQVTSKATIRDLLTHRIGLAREDALWYESGLDRQQILSKTDTIPMVSEFRGKFAYNSLMYLVAGEVASRIEMEGWDEQVTRRVFEPIGMARSSTRSDILIAGNNCARGHVLLDGELKPSPILNVDNCGPAVSLVSTAHDLGLWLRFLVNSGRLPDRTLVEDQTLHELFTPRIDIQPDEYLWKLFPDKTSESYGMGFIVLEYRNRTIVLHPGNVNGMRAVIALVPDIKVGIAILANREASVLTSALMYDIFDIYLGPIDAKRVVKRKAQLRKLQIETDQRYEVTDLIRRGHECLQASKPKEALERFEAALRISPEDAVALTNRGLTYIELGDPLRALRDFRRAIRLSPKSSRAYYGIGLADTDLNNFPEAVDNLSKAIELEPGFGPAFAYRANAKLNQGDYEGAIDDATKSIQRSPDFIAYAVRCVAWSHLGEEEKSQQDFEICVSLNAALESKLKQRMQDGLRAASEGKETAK